MEEVRVKAKLGEDFRRFALPIGNGCSLLYELNARITSIYSVSHFSLQYIDDEGDLITVHIEEELKEAIRVSYALCEARRREKVLNVIISNPVYIKREIKEELLVSNNNDTMPDLMEIDDPNPKVVVKEEVITEDEPTLLEVTMAEPPKTDLVLSPGLLKRADAPLVAPCKNPRFRDQFTIQEREKVATTMKNKYNDSVPIIIQKMETSIIQPDLSQNRFLIPKRQNVKQLSQLVGEFVNLKNKIQLFVEAVNNGRKQYYRLEDQDVEGLWVSRVYNEYKMEDQFLYVVFCSQDEALVDSTESL